MGISNRIDALERRLKLVPQMQLPYDFQGDVQAWLQTLTDQELEDIVSTSPELREMSDEELQQMIDQANPDGMG